MNQITDCLPRVCYPTMESRNACALRTVSLVTGLALTIIGTLALTGALSLNHSAAIAMTASGGVLLLMSALSPCRPPRQDVTHAYATASLPKGNSFSCTRDCFYAFAMKGLGMFCFSAPREAQSSLIAGAGQIADSLPE